MHAFEFGHTQPAPSLARSNDITTATLPCRPSAIGGESSLHALTAPPCLDEFNKCKAMRTVQQPAASSSGGLPVLSSLQVGDGLPVGLLDHGGHVPGHLHVQGHHAARRRAGSHVRPGSNAGARGRALLWAVPHLPGRLLGPRRRHRRHASAGPPHLRLLRCQQWQGLVLWWRCVPPEWHSVASTGSTREHPGALPMVRSRSAAERERGVSGAGESPSACTLPRLNGSRQLPSLEQARTT